MFRILLIGLIAMLVSGCNTVSGAGRDISNSADWVKGKVSGGSSHKAAPANKPDSSAPAQPAAPEPTAPSTTPAPSQVRT
ncbi:MAG: hypothetical protein IT507_09940 [Burkholderiaceae bacterium]|nr:hypothetical protein [Burkholderiaceae bacterium]